FGGDDGGTGKHAEGDAGAVVVGVEGEEPRLDVVAVAVHHAHVGAAGLAGAGDDLVLPVAVDVAGGDVEHTNECGRIVKEPAAGRAVLEEDADVRAAARACARHDLGCAVTVDVARRHAHTAHEPAVVGEEPAADRRPVGGPHAHMGPAAVAGARHQPAPAV